jgi:hypothetical protein
MSTHALRTDNSLNGQHRLSSDGMSCVIDLAELFGDETIEVQHLVDSDSKDFGNIDTTITCPVPPMCASILCNKHVASRADEDTHHRISETEAGYEVEERIQPEFSDLVIDEASMEFQCPNPQCCTDPEGAMFFSPLLIPHVDQKVQTEIRKAELEKVSLLSLAKQNGRCIRDTCSISRTN